MLILAAIMGGFRRGELVGMEWKSVDFENGTMEVVNTITKTKKGKAIEKGPKNKSSKRYVALPFWYIEELKEYRKIWLKEMEDLKGLGTWLGGEREYVFHNGTGKPFYHSTPYLWWKRFCARRGFQPIKFHALRHTCATLLVEEGAATKAVQVLLGHAKETTTSKTYSHVTKKLTRVTAEKFNKFAPKSNRPQFVPND